jgi:limonene-1,2-epoxide hydrolase
MADAQMDPLSVVMAFSNAMEKMDFDTGLQYVAHDIEYINSPDTRSCGPEGIRQVLEPFFAPIEENEFVILRKVTQGNFVVLERLDRHRAPQGWFELPVTGVYEVHSGRITYWREYFDFGTIRDEMQRIYGGGE